MRELHINPLFERYWSALDTVAYKYLVASMTSDLTSEPIFWWHNPETDQDEILEGHHRYRIAQQHDLDLQLHEKHFDTVDDAEEFVLLWQAGRRNVHENVLRGKYQRLLDITVKRDGLRKAEAVTSVAERAHVHPSTVYRDLAAEDEPEPTAIQAFYADKKEYERDLERTRNKAIEKLKQRAVKEGFSEDQDRLESEWGTIEDGIQAEFETRTVALESASGAIQAEAEASGKRPVVPGKKRGGKKSTQAKSALRSIRSYLDKIQGLAYHFPGGFIPIDWTAATAWIDEQQAGFDKGKKKKFGRRERIR